MRRPFSEKHCMAVQDIEVTSENVANDPFGDPSLPFLSPFPSFFFYSPVSDAMQCALVPTP